MGVLARLLSCSCSVIARSKGNKYQAAGNFGSPTRSAAAGESQLPRPPRFRLKRKRPTKETPPERKSHSVAKKETSWLVQVQKAWYFDGMTKKATKSKETLDAALKAFVGTLEAMPVALAGKAAPEAEVVRWVARNIDNPEASAKDCPDPFAWTLLRQCRDNPVFVAFFIEKLWCKLIPSRGQQEGESGGAELDGKPTLELIERLQTIRCGVEESGRPRLVHCQKIAGSNPAAATNLAAPAVVHTALPVQDHAGGTIPDEFSAVEGEPE